MSRRREISSSFLTVFIPLFLCLLHLSLVLRTPQLEHFLHSSEYCSLLRPSFREHPLIIILTVRDSSLLFSLPSFISFSSLSLSPFFSLPPSRYFLFFVGCLNCLIPPRFPTFLIPLFTPFLALLIFLPFSISSCPNFLPPYFVPHVNPRRIFLSFLSSMFPFLPSTPCGGITVGNTSTTVVPPYWKIEPKEAVSVIGGQNVLIDCLAEGSPSPSVTWERGSSLDSSAAPSSPRYYSVISSGPHFEVYPNGSLLIKNSLEEDSGFYLCQASNSIGPGISKLLTLTVHGMVQQLHNIFSFCTKKHIFLHFFQFYIHTVALLFLQLSKS